MKKIGWLGLDTIMTLAGGWMLAHVIVGLTDEMPDWMDRALRVLLHMTGHEEFANPDDLPALGMMAVLIASIVVAGLLVWAVHIAIARTRARRRQA